MAFSYSSSSYQGTFLPRSSSAVAVNADLLVGDYDDPCVRCVAALLANIGHWALRDYGFYSVDTKAGDFIGRIGVIYHDGWDEPELAWHLFDGFEGKGYAMEAALAARADYHARITQQPPISYIDVTNTRSEALAKRLGASIERTLNDEKGHHHVYRHPAPEARA